MSSTDGLTGDGVRIACLLNLSPKKLGSLEAWMARMSEEADRRGHHVDFYCHDPVHPALRERLTDSGAGVENIHRSLGGFWSARKLLATYDILHLTLFAPRSRVALASYCAWPARVLFVDQYSGPTRPEPRTSVIRRWVDHLTFRRTAGIAGVSDYVTGRDADRFGLPPERTRTIYNGVPLDRFDVGPPDDVGPPTLLAVASLIPEKGLDVLLRALARARTENVRLWIVGEGPQRERLEGLAEVLGIADRTSLLGLRDDVPDLLSRCHVFAHPAVWQEAFGFVIAEAMAAARPVVATRVGAIPELVDDRRTGLLVEPHDPTDLAASLDSLLGDADTARRLGLNGRRRAEEKFGLQRCVEAHLDWCEEEADSGRPPGRGASATRPEELPTSRREVTRHTSRQAP